MMIDIGNLVWFRKSLMHREDITLVGVARVNSTLTLHIRYGVLNFSQTTSEDQEARWSYSSTWTFLHFHPCQIRGSGRKKNFRFWKGFPNLALNF